MGTRHAVFLDAIPKALENGALSGKELIIKAEEFIPEDKKPNEPKKPFGEALVILLDKKDIEILDYDITKDKRKRKQSVTQNSCIFRLVKKEPFDILQLIRKSLGVDDEAAAAQKELKRLFYKKLGEIQKSNFQRWESLKSEVIVREPTDDELLWYEAYSIANDEFTELKKYSPPYHNYDSQDFYEMIISKMEELSTTSPHLQEKYKEYRLFLLQSHEDMVVREGVESLNPMPQTISDKHLFANKTVSKDDFLKEMGYEPPEEIDYDTSDNLFEEVQLYINSQDKGKDGLFNKLSIGLSDQKSSQERLDELISKVTKESIIIDYSFT